MNHRESQRGLDRARTVVPQPRIWIKGIVRQQLPAVFSHHGYRLHDVLKNSLANEVVEVDAHPTGLDPLAPVFDLAFKLVRLLNINSQQAVAVRSST